MSVRVLIFATVFLICILHFVRASVLYFVTSLTNAVFCNFKHLGLRLCIFLPKYL